MRTLFLATRNKHKIGELAATLGADFEVKSVFDAGVDLPEIEETGDTFLANAALKAEGISQYVSGWVLADDSGIEIDALGGRPGVLSARYAGPACDDEANNGFLLHELAEAGATESTQRTARYRCVLVVAEGGRTLASFDGACEGTILPVRQGTGGFGYDPLFVPAGHTESFGVLPAETKAAISHRAKAMASFAAWAAIHAQ